MRSSTFLLLGGLAAAVGLYLYSRTQSGQASASGVADLLGSAGDSVKQAWLTVTQGPRGIRNNNPGNIVRSNIAWQGVLTEDQVQSSGATWDPTFLQFDTPANGVRAIGHVLLAKAARGLNSVDAIVRDYSLTDQDVYVQNVSQALGVDPYQTIDVGAVLPAFATAIIQQENGEQPYDLNDIANWVYS